MKLLTERDLKHISGAMNLEGLRGSSNIVDLRGVDMGSWIDAANMCWKPGTSSIIMFPGGFYIPNLRF